jgi:hypothetical protein
MQAWHFDKGHVNGIDMTGRTVGAAFHIPGNVLKGDFRAALYIDDGASDEQQQALLDLYGGKLGGPVAELAKLVGEVVSVERVPITFAVNEGRGTLRIADAGFAELEPYRGPHWPTRSFLLFQAPLYLLARRPAIDPRTPSWNMIWI